VLDLVMMALVALAFAAAFGYVWACADLARPAADTPDKPA
jgi:hypothetical protein